eukprot:scaffold6124_cov122-Cylindrotheca_fusiformis.AAC.22
MDVIKIEKVIAAFLSQKPPESRFAYGLQHFQNFWHPFSLQRLLAPRKLPLLPNVANLLSPSRGNHVLHIYILNKTQTGLPYRNVASVMKGPRCGFSMSAGELSRSVYQGKMGFDKVTYRHGEYGISSTVDLENRWMSLNSHPNEMPEVSAEMPHLKLGNGGWRTRCSFLRVVVLT